MPTEKKRYKVVGITPVDVDGTTHYPGQTFESAAELSFQVGIGALKLMGEKKK